MLRFRQTLFSPFELPQFALAGGNAPSRLSESGSEPRKPRRVRRRRRALRGAI
jgi:hypothetical protein